MEAVAVAVIAGFFGVLSIVVQARVHRDNRADHADTAAKVDQVLEAQGVMGADLGEMKADLREVKADVREHGARLRAIESPTPKKPRKAT